MTRMIGVLITLIITVGVSVCSAKEWRGIIPLKSTRAHVERILGPSKDKSDLLIYTLPEESVVIWYSRGQCDEGWNVASDTVLYFNVYPKIKEPLDKLELDLKKYKKVKGDYDVPDHFYYVDDEQGLTLSVRKGILINYTYGPMGIDANLRCPKTGETPPKCNDENK